MRHRTNSAVLATSSDWVFNYMIVQITPIANSNIWWKTHIVFFVLNAVSALVVFLSYPGFSPQPISLYRITHWLIPYQKRVTERSRKSIYSTRGIATGFSWWTSVVCYFLVPGARWAALKSLRAWISRLILRMWDTWLAMRRDWDIMRKSSCYSCKHTTLTSMGTKNFLVMLTAFLALITNINDAKIKYASCFLNTW